MSNYFTILRPSPKDLVSGALPASTSYSKGTAFQMSATYGTLEAADGTLPIAGFLTTDVDTEANIQIAQMKHELMLADASHLPIAQGSVASLEDGDEIQLEGSGLVDSGITSSTALKTEIAFTGGKAKAASTGEYVEFMLIAKPTPQESGQVAIVIQRVPGYKKA